MSTEPSNVTVFQLGQEASASTFIGALDAIQHQGTVAIDALITARTETLVEFNRRTSAINNRRVRTGRAISPQQAIKFVVSDFSDIDQANTIATVRADSASVSLKERAVPAEASVKSKVFSSNIGSIESLDTAQSLLSVTVNDSDPIPTGQFDIELVVPLRLNQFIIDIIATPSTPTIKVTISTDGLSYTSATKVALNGYRVNVWITPQEVRFIRVQITPALPDNLNGNTYTFGITDFTAQATEFHLASDFFTKTLQFSPKSAFISLDAVENPNIQYYLSIYPTGDIAAPFVEMNPGDLVSIGSEVSSTIITTPSNPEILGILPESTYPSTIQVTEAGNGLLLAPGLSASDPNLSRLQNEYVSIDSVSTGIELRLVNGSGHFYPPRTFVISYVYGPALVSVQLRVRLSTSDRAISPVFQGASLDEI